jgi:heat-inducible transcriptional repressor
MAAEDRNGALNQRQHTLLLAAIHEFILTAGPVGSQQLASHHPVGIRAAMVRNIMAELEDGGFLYQPHTSAGRIPTERAFRYFVDSLIPPPPIPFHERAQIELHYSAPSPDINEVVRDTSRFLALLTGQAAIVMAPRLDSVNIDRVQFVRLREREVLAVFIAKAGGVQNRLVQTDDDYSEAELDRMAGYLNESLSGRTLEQARQWIQERLSEDWANYDRLSRAALMLGDAIARNPALTEVYVEGGSKALDQPEFADPTRLRELLRALEDKTALLDLLERTLTRNGLMVSIGSENHHAGLSDFSVVAASYASGAMPLGSLAIIGPVRMDYERVIPLVSYTAKVLSRAFEH